jgi:CBS domain-containing protein
MLVSDIMTRQPVTIRSNAPVREALEAMERVGCHHLPVLSAASHLIGVITARDCRLALSLPDVVREYWQEDELSHVLPVSSVMSAAPTVIAPESSVTEAARLMLDNYVSCLPVMRDETLVGIITVSDILVAFTRVQL